MLAVKLVSEWETSHDPRDQTRGFASARAGRIEGKSLATDSLDPYR
jgi:hypothetical protein